MVTFQLTAEYKSPTWGGDESMPQGVTFSLRVESVERAREIAAQFPKSYKVRGVSLTTIEDGQRVERGHVGWARRLSPDGTNGGENEAGIAAYYRMIAKLDQFGYGVEWATPYGNSYRTREAFEANI